MARYLKLPSGKEVVLTTHAEKYWQFYVFLAAVTLTVGFLRLMDSEMGYGGVLDYVYYALPGIANVAIYFFGYYIEALKQDQNEFYNPAVGINDDENHFIEGREGEGYGRRYMGTKPTHVQWARSGGDILAAPFLAWGLGLVIAAFWPKIRSWYYQL